jgi:hypothetical protein
MKKFGIITAVIIISIIAVIISIVMEVIEFLVGVTFIGIVVLTMGVLYARWKMKG